MKQQLQVVFLSFAMCAFYNCRGGGPVPILPDKIVGSCYYKNKFSNRQECRDYVGEWSEKAATDDCKGQSAQIVLDEACDSEVRLGYCILEKDGKYTRITFPGDDESQCGSSKLGCEFFGGGVFDPSPVCGGELPQTPTVSGQTIFQQPILNCVDPRSGEASGRSANGQVCTWEMISGATEPGRKFMDYASCDRVRTQRPYYPAPPEDNATKEDIRLQDPTYFSELQWVRQEIEATACVCCHSSTAPKGASNWFIESEGNFINSFYPRGLAMGAGWIDTVGFGAYPPEQNNGFFRATPERPQDSIFVTTDPTRMARFFAAELVHRGYQRSDFADEKNGAGPLDLQRFYQPEACQNEEGILADGTILWQGGEARYLYILEKDSQSPGVPPNLDLPQGTLWRIDVAFDGTPIKSGEVKYGIVSTQFSQKYPVNASAIALESKQTYYLYVLADIAIPITRCLFVAP